MRRDSLYIVMPAYNEEENLREVIRQWYPVVDRIGGGSRLVILNDGSKDQTFSVIRDCLKEYPRLIGINKKNEGHGATLLAGYRYAIREGADYIFQTDSDGQTLPEEFWPLWENREEGGLQIGYRRDREDGCSRKLVTRVLRLVVFLFLGVRTRDANTPFRLMKAEELRRVLRKIPPKYFLANVLMTAIYEKNDLGVRYYPITFRPRQGGSNSINGKRILKIGLQSLRDFRKLRKNLRGV